MTEPEAPSPIRAAPAHRAPVGSRLSRRVVVGVIALALVAGTAVFIYEQTTVSVPGTGASSASGLAIQGITAFKAGHYRLAERLFTEEIRAAKSDNARAVGYYNLGTVMGRTHRVAESVTDYETAVRLASRFALAWMNLGIAEGALNKPSSALQAYNKLLALEPTNVQGLFNSGLILYHQGDKTNGVTRIKRAIQLRPSLAHAVPSWVNLG